MESPGVTDEWSFKDVVAHLNGWRRLTVARLEAAVQGSEQPTYPWPDGMTESTEDGTHEINHYFFEGDRDRPLEEILAENRDQWDRMRAALAAIPEADLLTPGRYSWLGGVALSAVLAGSFEHLHVEHLADIRVWLDGTSG
jgi:hypothetical protein